MEDRSKCHKTSATHPPTVLPCTTSFSIYPSTSLPRISGNIPLVFQDLGACPSGAPAARTDPQWAASLSPDPPSAAQGLALRSSQVANILPKPRLGGGQTLAVVHFEEYGRLKGQPGQEVGRETRGHLEG